MDNSQFIIVLDGSVYKPMYEYMLIDLSVREDVTFVTDEKKNGKIKKLLLKNKIQKMTGGKLDFLGFEENNLYYTIKYYCEQGKEVYVVFLNAALYYNAYLPETLLRYKKKWSGLKYILFYLDIMNVDVSFNADFLRRKNVFDLVYSIDKNDVSATDAIFWRTFYSKSSKYLNVKVQKDMYFCGASKGRIPLLKEIASSAEHNGSDITMDVVCGEDTELLGKHKSINIRKPENFISYPEVLSNELKSSCILEIVQQGQVAPTLRSYEAVVYNRKLLTNNKGILEFPFYNPKYMKYFDNVQNIDWNWVKDDSKVDYGYKGEFSPLYLLDDIKNRLEKQNLK